MNRVVHLEALEIEGFRGISKLKGAFGPGLNVIVGRNNVGKSALLDAIRISLGPTALQGEWVTLTRDDFHVPAGADAALPPTSPIGISLQFGNVSQDQQADFLELLDYDSTAPEKSKVRVHFEAIWDERKQRAHARRWGGAKDGDRSPIDPDLLADIPVTFLPALRDANQALQPGVKNRLARLVERRAREDETKRAEIEKIFEEANSKLDRHPFIKELADGLRKTTQEASGSDFTDFNVRAAQRDVQSILRTLRLLLAEGLPALNTTGLGYSNILFMSTVLAHLEGETKHGTAPILLIEEPEAHLHPQLTQLLARYLAGRTGSGTTTQVLATSHSPTFACQVKPSQVVSMSAPSLATEVSCNHLGALGLTDREELELQRMMDVTKSTLYFAKGIILVEGPCEALVLPELARRLHEKYDLAKLHVSIIPIAGVSFGAFQKILSDKGVRVPVAIITDGDPAVVSNGDWKADTPQKEGNAFAVCDRTKILRTALDGKGNVKVFSSDVTLEFDLANAGDGNPHVMAEAWETLFTGVPGTFNTTKLQALGTREEKALAAWRGICRSKTEMGKPEFAQRLAHHLRDAKVPFTVPAYLAAAIKHVADPLLEAPAPAAKSNG